MSCTHTVWELVCYKNETVHVMQENVNIFIFWTLMRLMLNFARIQWKILSMIFPSAKLSYLLSHTSMMSQNQEWKNATDNLNFRLRKFLIFTIERLIWKILFPVSVSPFQLKYQKLFFLKTWQFIVKREKCVFDNMVSLVCPALGECNTNVFFLQRNCIVKWSATTIFKKFSLPSV